MTKEIKLEANKRTEKNGKAKNVRREGFIPAIIYGGKAESSSIKVKDLDFNRVFAVAGESHLIDLAVDGASPAKVIVKDIQKDSLTDKIIHIDFYQVDMKKKIIAAIPLHFVGESKAVKELGGTLVKNMDELRIECLPENLVDYIEVNLSSLENLHDAIKISDIKLPAELKLASEADETVATVLEQAKEEEKAPVVEAAPAETPAEETKEAKEAKEEEKEKKK
jgi:large subunit ribosomal protein L25